MSNAAAIAIPLQNSIAAILNLEDPNERRIFDCIQAFYNEGDRLPAMRRGSVDSSDGPVRMLWTLGSFHPARKGARIEWMVASWHIDEIAVRFRRCKDETEARAAYKLASHPDADLPGVRLEKK